MSAAADSPRLRALKSAPLNSWVALSSDETSIVAIGNTYDEVSKKLDDPALADSIVLKTPEHWASFSV
jgi:hypothetical protein